MFKIFVSILFLGLFISGCATKKSEAHIKFEKDKLMHDLFSLKTCRIENSKKLDDGVSSVEIIATVVIKACVKESKYVMNQNMLDISDEYRKSFADQMNGVQTSGVINIILEHRAKKD